MRRKIAVLTLVLTVLAAPSAAQHTPWLHWTLLPDAQMAEIIGEASGETAWNTVMETGGYNQDRPAEAYGKGTFYEARYILEQLKKYGIPGAAIERFPGGEVWDGSKGELWEITPMRQKLASYRDMTAQLAGGSRGADVTAELVWVGRGTRAEIQAARPSGKIVVTEGSASAVHALACQQMGAEGVIAISQSRPAFDPLQIPWRGIRSRGPETKPARFAFLLPFREGIFLKERLLRGQKITVRAQVESRMMPYELQDPVGHIPGTDPRAGEIILSAHLFEGYVKQGANDNKSGSAGILEVARVLHTLIEEGRLPRPRRTIRFLWGPEFSGTGPWVRAHKDLMADTLCNINMDMVGEWLSLNQAFMCLMRTSYAHPHYINDVMENYYRFVGEGNRERIHRGAPFPYKYPRRIVAPTGADEPFLYSIENHFGASDHEVFNDWGVMVPGVMMIAWPDQWYHTSGDRVDKSDPTQMKRVAVIGAAAAYTVAAADDDMAVRIASEIAGNAARRLGHQLTRGVEKLNAADGSGLGEAYRLARVFIETGAANEKSTLDSVMELAEDSKRVGGHVAALKRSVDALAAAHMDTIAAHLRQRAAERGGEPVPPALSPVEERAARLVPKPTARVKAGGYRAYRDDIEAVAEDVRRQHVYNRRDIANPSELQCLIDGNRSVLDIKNNLDAQYQRESDLAAILDYIEILRAAGLIEYR